MKSETKYMTLTILTKFATEKSSGFVGVGGPVQSLPIPVIKQGKLKIVFLYYPLILVNKNIYPPEYMLTLDAESAELEEIKAVTPTDFGIDHKSDEVIGVLHKLPDHYIQKQEKLNEIYDSLLPEYVSGHLAIKSEIRAQAIEFKNQFYELGGPILMPYYKTAAKDFFAWIDRIAQ